MRTDEQKLECIKKAILNSKAHKEAGDPIRVYSQYIRYALDELKSFNFCISKEATGLKRKDVIHEHVVPHSIVMNKLLSLDPLTNENILRIIKNITLYAFLLKKKIKI